jgi:hypothetical protein
MTVVDPNLLFTAYFAIGMDFAVTVGDVLLYWHNRHELKAHKK